MKYLLPLFILISISSCKKEETQDNNNPGNPTPAHYSTTIYTLDFTLQDVPYHFEFGENGYGFQYSSFVFQTEEEAFLSGTTSLTWNGDPKTTNQGYVAFGLPTCVLPSSEWEANSAVAFLKYLAGDYPIVPGDDTNLPVFSFTEPDGTNWNSYNAVQTGSTANCFGYQHAVETESPAVGVNGGEASINIYNLLTDETQTINLTWNILFREP